MLRRARLLVLNSPVNPSGGVISAEDLEEIAWWAERHDVLVLSDESFACYLPEGSSARIGAMPRARTAHVDGGKRQPKSRFGLGARRLVGRLPPSAAALSAHRRTSFAVCSHVMSANRLVGLAQAIRRLTPIAPSSPRRRFAFERLRAQSDLNPTWPAGGFFLWVPVWEQGVSGRCFAERLLRERQVRVTAGDLFGPSGKGYIRISCAINDGRLEQGLNRLSEFVASGPALSLPHRRPQAA